MSKIKITESELRQLIGESVVSVLNESANDVYTLDELLRDQNYNGNKQMLLQALSLGLTAYRKSRGVKGAMALTNQMRIKGSDWMQIFKFAQQKANPAMRQVIANISAAASQTINAKTPQQGVEDALKKGGEMTVGNPYSTGPGDQNVAPNAGKPFTFTQLTQSLSNKRGTTMSFQQVLHDSVGPWNGQNETVVKNTINAQIRRTMPTLQQTNPKNAQKAKNIIDKWLAGGYPYRINDVHWSMNVFDQALKSSRNDMPAVRGFQQTLNLFGLKDAKGKPFAVDGIVGQNTSAALKQNGFKNIFDFINVVKGVQKALGLKDDGIVGKNTLAAFQQNGINSFDVLKNFARIKTSKENLAQNQISQGNLTMPTPQLSAPQTGGLVRENKKIKVSENELKKLIKESVETILKAYKK